MASIVERLRRYCALLLFVTVQSVVPQEPSSKLTEGQIVGIVIASILGTALLICVLYAHCTSAVPLRR